MKYQSVLKQGLLSEKVYSQMESGIYTFLVSKSSTKLQIKKAVENQFGVKVLKINIATKASKSKRVTGTRKMFDTASGKKAVVYLQSGQNIEMLSPKKESKKNVSKGNEENKKVEKKGLLSKISLSKKEKEASS